MCLVFPLSRKRERVGVRELAKTASFQSDALAFAMVKFGESKEARNLGL
jgi:hypothetical protein